MPKQHSDSLFQLIKSLSKSEKRAFKLFAGRTGGKEEKKMILLFDRIDRQKKYDEEKILRREEHLSRKQMPNLKAHLFSQILKCLSLMTPKDEEKRTAVLLDYGRILYNKCLYDESLKMIEKARKTAMRADAKILLMEILELEKLVVRQTVHEKNQARIASLIRETENAAASIRNINIFSYLALKLNSLYQRTGFIKNRQDYEKVKKFFVSSLPRYDEKKISFHEKMYLYYSFTGYYFFIQDFRNGYRYAKKWLSLFDKHPEMIYRKPEMYLRAMNSVMGAENKLYRYRDFHANQKKLAALKRDKKFTRSENINLNLFKTIYLHEINRHFMLGEFISGTKIVRKLENELAGFIPKLDRHTVLIFYYKIACLYFGAGNFKSAVKWLNKIINEKETGLREDLHGFARILRLISYYEIGDEELLQYSIKSVYRFLLKKGSLHRYHRLLLDFLKNLPRYDSMVKLLTAFSRLKEEMQKLENSRYEKRAFLYFDIISWLESKIERRPVEGIIKEKAGKKIFR